MRYSDHALTTEKQKQCWRETRKLERCTFRQAKFGALCAAGQPDYNRCGLPNRVWIFVAPHETRSGQEKKIKHKPYPIEAKKTYLNNRSQNSATFRPIIRAQRTAAQRYLAAGWRYSGFSKKLCLATLLLASQEISRQKSDTSRK